EVLSDPQKRSNYDRFGHADPGEAAGAGSGFGGFGGAGADFSFGDIFDMFFGGGRRNPHAPRQGADLEFHMELEFKDAVFGKETDIYIPRTETCSTCGGNGAKPGTQPERCPLCRGTGQAETVQNTPRSEERRVGKECRSRWAPDHEKKKERDDGDCGGGTE